MFSNGRRQTGEGKAGARAKCLQYMATTDPSADPATQRQPPLKPPPVDALLTEIVATLAIAAHGYLAGEPGAEEPKPDLVAAEMAIDVAGAAFERVRDRLGPQERAAVAGMLTDIRLAFVRKRGS